MKIPIPVLTDNDSIVLVRVAFKCADILSETDTLLYLAEQKASKYLKREIKLQVKNFSVALEEFSSSLLKGMYLSDENLSQNLQQGFRDFTDQIYLGDDETTAFGLVYSMALSIVHDLRTITYTDTRVAKLYNSAYKLATSVPIAHPHLLKIVDKHGNGIAAIVETFDMLGKKIMYGYHRVTKGEAFYLFSNGKCIIQKVKNVTKTHVECTKGKIPFKDFRENPDVTSNVKYVAYL
jgi:hypothetical protein